MSGRPSEFKPEYCDEVIKLMSQGALDYNIASKWGISRKTFWRWKNEIPEFSEAYDIGFEKCEEWWAEWGKKGMQGEIKGFNFMAWQSFMNNKFKWTQKNDGSTQINIGNMNVLSSKSNDELLEILNQKLNRLSQYKEVEVLDVKPTESE